MSEWEPESQVGGVTEELEDDKPVGDPDDDDESGWDETNDEPAEGEQGQDTV